MKRIEKSTISNATPRPVNTPISSQETRKLYVACINIAAVKYVITRNIDFFESNAFPYPYPVNADTEACSRHPANFLL